jgi:hypothetical protein
VTERTFYTWHCDCEIHNYDLDDDFTVRLHDTPLILYVAMDLENVESLQMFRWTHKVKNHFDPIQAGHPYSKYHKKHCVSIQIFFAEGMWLTILSMF